MIYRILSNRFDPVPCTLSLLSIKYLGARHVVIGSLTFDNPAKLQQRISMHKRVIDGLKQINPGPQTGLSVSQLGRCRASLQSAEKYHAPADLEHDIRNSAISHTPIMLLWLSLGMLAWCTQRWAAAAILCMSNASLAMVKEDTNDPKFLTHVVSELKILVHSLMGHAGRV
jgi:hypothetical protein